MFKLLERFTTRKSQPAQQSNSGTFHPNTPVIPQEPVDYQKIAVFRRENFPQHEPSPWLDRQDAPNLVERAIAKGKIQPEPNCEVNGLPGRNLNTHFQVAKMAELLRDRTCTDTISMLLGAKCLPFQTITGHNGSQQLEHSDAIHMTTYPMDYLAATWTAFEDINPDSGPLVYYPGSHRLPHFLSQEAEISIEEFKTRGYVAYHQKYEPRLQKIIQENQLEAQYFDAKKGDGLNWHCKKIQEGLQNFALSRKALVCHYFAEGCICYHDLASSISSVHS